MVVMEIIIEVLESEFLIKDVEFIECCELEFYIMMDYILFVNCKKNCIFQRLFQLYLFCDLLISVQSKLVVGFFVFLCCVKQNLEGNFLDRVFFSVEF